ncbi:MAG: hypothetical protein AB7F40_10310 [Victivallaceae bacterium]
MEKFKAISFSRAERLAESFMDAFDITGIAFERRREIENAALTKDLHAFMKAPRSSYGLQQKKIGDYWKQVGNYMHESAAKV